MTIVLPVTGSLNWDVSLNAALTNLQNQITSGPPAGAAGGDLSGTYPSPLVTSTHLSSPLPIAQGGSGAATAPAARTALGLSVETVPGITHFNVKDYLAVGDGTTDDLTPIQNAINAAAVNGGIVFFPAGVYRISNSIVMKTGVTLQGVHGTGWPFRFPTSICSIRPTNSFAGECAISMLGQDITISGHNEGNMRIIDIDLDGSALPAGSVTGIHAQGEVMDVILQNMTIKQFTHDGIQTNTGSGTRNPHDWFMDSVVCYNNATYGYSMQITDGYIRNCIASSNTIGGWSMAPFGGITMQGCQALFNGGDGLTVTGGTSTGNLVISDFMTDRNEHNGITLGTNSGSGSPPIILSGITCNRDGRNANAGGGGYAGIFINTCANPIIIEGAIVGTGVDDDTTGTNSPQNGIKISGSAYVSVGSGYFHGNTTGWLDDGTNTIVRRGINIGEATGLKATPTFVYTNGVSTVDGNVTAAGNALGLPRPHNSNNAAIAWTADPVTINGSTAPAASGTVYLSALYVSKSITATKLFWGVQTPGLGTPVAGQNFVGIYNSAGTLLQSVNVDGRTGTNTIFTETISVALTPGMYWIGFVFNATTLPGIIGPAGLLATAINFNDTASTSRWAVNGTGQTSLPATITPASNTGPSISRFYWAALA